MTTKKRVLLDVFEESVLPMLEQKHKKDATKIQSAIDDGYYIYEVVGEGDEAKERRVKFSVSAPAKELNSDGEEVSEEDRIAAAVAKALDAERKKNPPSRNPLNADGKSNDGKFKIPAEAKRVGQLKAFTQKSVTGSEFDAEERAFRFGMWGKAAMGSETAKQWCAEHGIGLREQKFADELLQKLHSESTNTAGGYLVPEEFGTDLILLREQYGLARRLCNVVPMSSDTRTDPRQTGGLTSYFVAEGDAGTESTMSWDQVRLTAKDLMVLSRMTNQVNADSVISFGDTLAYECAYAFALKEDQCVFIGDGTSTYGGITGVRTQLTNKWGTPVVAGSAYGITKASSTTIASLALADFENAVGSLPQYAAVRNPVWVCHSFFYYSTMLRLALAAGGNTEREVATGNRAPRPLFLGYPVEFSQVLGSTTAATTVFALLGDFSLGVTFGDRQQNMISFSEHASVGSQSVFERNEVAVRAVERFDVNVHDVGDGTTLGPIVGVATG